MKHWESRNPDDQQLTKELPADKFIYNVANLVPNQEYVYQVKNLHYLGGF